MPAPRLLRTGLGGVSVGLVLVLVVSYAATCFVYLSVFSSGGWVGGVVVSSVARARAGGASFETAGSLFGPTWPYFPLVLFLGRGLAALGVPVVSLPAVLGGAATFALPLAAAGLARCLGARWLPSLALSFFLYALVLLRYHTFDLMAAGSFPDALVADLLIVVCLVLARVERSAAPSWPERLAFGAALVAAGLSKQVGVAGVIGSFVYLALASPVKGRVRRELLAVVVASGVVVVAVVLATPGCFQHTVVVISRHAKDWKRLDVLWDHLLGRHLPTLLVYLVSVPAVLQASGDVRRRFLHYHAILLPVIAVQVLATVKDGGGGQYSSYNMELVQSLLLPVAVWAGASTLSRAPPAWQVAMIAVLAGVGVKVSRDVREPIAAGRDASWARMATTAADLRHIAKPGPAFAKEEQAWALHQAGFWLATGTSSLWHYAAADPQATDPRWLEGVERALRERLYTVVQIGCFQTLPDRVIKRLQPLLQAGYVTAPGGAWLVPRP